MPKYRVDTEGGSYIVETEGGDVIPGTEQTGLPPGAPSPHVKGLHPARTEMGRLIEGEVLGGPVMPSAIATGPLRFLATALAGTAGAEAGQAGLEAAGVPEALAELGGNLAGLVSGGVAVKAKLPPQLAAVLARLRQPETIRAGIEILPKGEKVLSFIDKLRPPAAQAPPTPANVNRPAPAWQQIADAVPVPPPAALEAPLPGRLPSGRMTPAQREALTAREPAGPSPNVPEPAPGATGPLQAPAQPIAGDLVMPGLPGNIPAPVAAKIRQTRAKKPLTPAEELAKELTGSKRGGTIPAPQPEIPAAAYEGVARATKVDAIADVLHKHGITVEQLRQFGPEQWAMAAQGAGAKVPSAESITQIKVKLGQLEKAARRSKADQIARDHADELSKN